MLSGGVSFNSADASAGDPYKFRVGIVSFEPALNKLKRCTGISGSTENKAMTS